MFVIRSIYYFVFSIALFNIASAETILSNTDHASSNIQTTLSVLGSSAVVDQTCASGMGSPVCGAAGSFVVPGAPFVSYALGAGPFYSQGTTTVVNHQPYTVLTESSTNYSLLFDQQNYTALMTNSIIYTMPNCPSSPLTTYYPPVSMVTVLPFGSPAWPISQCGYDGGTEFSLSTNYLYSGSTASPSSTNATMAGILSAMKSNHPSWTWNDIKGALRQTASNWSTGFAANNSGSLGYGNVNYANATALSGTSAIYLQAPGMSVTNHTYYVMVTLWPFLTTRRSKEVVYIGGTWPAPSTTNEYTAAQIAAAGGTKIFDNGGTTGVQSFSYAPAASGSAVLTALTVDAGGNGSRVESFSQSSQTFLIGTSCLQ